MSASATQGGHKNKHMDYWTTEFLTTVYRPQSIEASIIRTRLLRMTNIAAHQLK